MKIFVDGKTDTALSVNKDIVITSVKGSDNRNLNFLLKEDSKDKKKLFIYFPKRIEGEVILRIEYRGRLAHFPEDIKFTREFLSDKPVAYVGEEIILLDGASCWYPCIKTVNETATFKVTAITPKDYEIVMEGDRVSRKVNGGITNTIWDFPYPSSGIYLVGGRYIINEDKYNDIKLYTYLFPVDVSLSSTYMEHTKKYLELYERLLGKYPFKKFAVVENILATGYGMPSYTLLGQSVMRLPFIVKTSLGHEIAHNWWGNSVYPDYESGNWSEGLTTYMADHMYDDQEGKGPQYRNQLLRDYANHVEPSEEYPLTEFKNRTTPEDRALGYGKGAYIFHMLRIMLGDEMFYKGLRSVVTNKRFKSTQWGDFRKAFETVSGRELGWFFKQWVERSGAPEINLGEVSIVEHQEGYTVRAQIIQKEKAYEIYLPVSLETVEGPMLTYHWIKGRDNIIEIDVFENDKTPKPKSIIIDPYYDVFRRLNPEEVPSTIGKFFGAESRQAILPSKVDKELIDVYANVASGIENVTIKFDKKVTEKDLRQKSLYLLGGLDENIITERFISNLPDDIKLREKTISINGTEYDKNDSVLVVAISSPLNQNESLLILSGEKPEYIESVAEKISHYGRYSYLLFFKGGVKEKGIWTTSRMEKRFH